MNDKSFELNIILFILLFVLTLIVFNMGSLAGYSLIVLYCVVSMCIHFCNFIDYNVITALRSGNEIKMHSLFTDSYISNKFC